MSECNRSCKHWPPSASNGKPCSICNTSEPLLDCYQKKPKGRPKGTGQYNQSYRIRLSDKQKSQLKSIAIKHNKSEAAMLRELIKEAFERS